MVRHLSAQQLRNWRDQGDGQPLMLDVREPWEVRICLLPGSKHIPMREIPARVHDLPIDHEIVVICHDGHRSQHVANFLAQRGYENVYNLQGGIDAWAREVDTRMPRY
jgi:rhodanese-related sulfurtransferase